jgi:hypothetical protein
MKSYYFAVSFEFILNSRLHIPVLFFVLLSQYHLRDSLARCLISDFYLLLHLAQVFLVMFIIEFAGILVVFFIRKIFIYSVETKFIEFCFYAVNKWRILYTTGSLLTLRPVVYMTRAIMII